MKTIITNVKGLIMIIKTKNFNPKTDIKLCCTCGEAGCDKRSVKLMALNMLQKVREVYGLPMIVTSGGRCPLHKNEKHRIVPADHQKGLGVDIAITGLVMAMKLIAIASKCGFNAFGINLKAGFIHLGYRPEQNKISVWTY
jgi:zinc D-Ala-D-Ala carboxypeptidase